MYNVLTDKTKLLLNEYLFTRMFECFFVKNALTCIAAILKITIAETSIQNGGLLYDYLLK